MNNAVVQNCNFNNNNSTTPSDEDGEQSVCFLVALSVSGDGVLIEDCNFDGTTSFNHSGIEVVSINANDVVIRNCQVTNSSTTNPGAGIDQAGFSIVEASDIAIENCVISDFSSSGISAGYNFVGALSYELVNNLVIKNVVVQSIDVPTDNPSDLGAIGFASVGISATS